MRLVTENLNRFDKRRRSDLSRPAGPGRDAERVLRPQDAYREPRGGEGGGLTIVGHKQGRNVLLALRLAFRLRDFDQPVHRLDDYEPAAAQFRRLQ